MWTCVNRRMAEKFYDQFIFVNESGQVAFADHSIRNLNDPSSTESGLLIWDGGHGIIVEKADKWFPPRIVHEQIVRFKVIRTLSNGKKEKTSIITMLVNAFILAQLVEKDITEIVPGIFDGVNFNPFNKACC